MSVKNRTSQSWDEDVPGIDIAGAADAIRTPDGKPQKKQFGLAAAKRNAGGGGAGKRPMSAGGASVSMGMYDRHGNAVEKSRGGRGAGLGGRGGSRGSTMQAASSGMVKRSNLARGTQVDFFAPPATKTGAGKARGNQSGAARAAPGNKASLQFAISQSVPATPTQARQKGGAKIRPGASLSKPDNARKGQNAIARAREEKEAKKHQAKNQQIDRWRWSTPATFSSPFSAMGQASNTKYGSSNRSSDGSNLGRNRSTYDNGARSTSTSVSQSRTRELSPVRRRKPQQHQQRGGMEQGHTIPRAKKPKKPELVTIDDSTDEEAEEEDVLEMSLDSGIGAGGEQQEGGSRKRQRREIGNGVDDDNEENEEWCKQSSTNPSGSDEESVAGREGKETATREQGESTAPSFGSVPELEAEAITIGKSALVGRCHVVINMTGKINITLKGDGDAVDTTLSIPPEEITFFGFCPGSKKLGRAFISIGTKADGKIANDPSYRGDYDPSDKGAAGLITVFLPADHDFAQHEASIRDALKGSSSDPVAVNTNMTGELPSVLRRNLENQEKKAKAEEEVGLVRTRRTLRSGVSKGDFGKVLFHYPPEASASDRIAINSLDEARTQEGEFLNDSLVDLYLKHMHKEAFRTWDRKEVGGSDGDDVGNSAGVDAKSDSNLDGVSAGADGAEKSEAGSAEGELDCIDQAASGAASAPEGNERDASADADAGADVSAGPTRRDAAAAAAAAAAAGGGGSGGDGRRTESMDDEKVHVFTSHFFTKLTETRLHNFDAAYSKVQHWTRNVDLFTKKFVFVPVVEDMHWSLACLCNLDKLEEGKDSDDVEDDGAQPCMLFLDSLDMHYASRIWEYLRKYLERKWKESARNREMTFDKFVLPLVRPRVPTQINGCDCGVYVLRYAKEICQQWPRVTKAEVKNSLKAYFKPHLFSPSDIEDERRKLRELLQECKLRYDHEKQQQQQMKKKKRPLQKSAEKDRARAEADTDASSRCSNSSSGGSGGGSSSSTRSGTPELQELRVAEASTTALIRSFASGTAETEGVDNSSAERSATTDSHTPTATAGGEGVASAGLDPRDAGEGSAGTAGTTIEPPVIASANARNAERNASVASGKNVTEAASGNDASGDASPLDSSSDDEKTDTDTEKEDPLGGADSGASEQLGELDEGVGGTAAAEEKGRQGGEAEESGDAEEFGFGEESGYAEEASFGEEVGDEAADQKRAMEVLRSLATSGGATLATDAEGGDVAAAAGRAAESEEETGRGEPAVVDIASSEGVPESGNFQAKGGGWGRVPESPTPEEEDEEEGITGEVDAEEASNVEADVEGASAGARSGNISPKPVRRIKSAARSPSKAAMTATAVVARHGAEMVALAAEGRGDSQCAEPTSSKCRRQEKSERSLPLQQLGRNEETPRPSVDRKGVGTSTASSIARANTTSSSSSTSRGRGAAEAAAGADENSLSPRKASKRRKQADAPVRAADAGGELGGSKPQRGRNIPSSDQRADGDVVVLDASGADASDGDDSLVDGCNVGTAPVSRQGEAPPVGKAPGPKAADASATAQNAVRTTPRSSPRRNRLGAGAGNALVGRDAAAAAAAAAAFASGTAETAKAEANSPGRALFVGDDSDQDEGEGSDCEDPGEEDPVLTPPSSPCGAGSATAKNAFANSRKYGTSGGAGASAGCGEEAVPFDRTLGERNKLRRQKLVAAAAAAAAASDGGDCGNRARQPEENENAHAKSPASRGERRSRRAAEEQTPSPRKRGKSAAAKGAIDLASPARGGHDDRDTSSEGGSGEVEVVEMEPQTVTGKGKSGAQRDGTRNRRNQNAGEAAAGGQKKVGGSGSRPSKVGKGRSKRRRIVEELSDAEGETGQEVDRERADSEDY